jgi:hypothetical protein
MQYAVVALTGTGLTPLSGLPSFPGMIDAIVLANSDSISHTFELVTDIGGGGQVFAGCTVGAGVGFGGTASIDALAAALPPTVLGLPFNSAQIYQVEIMEAIATGGKAVNVIVFYHLV